MIFSFFGFIWYKTAARRIIQEIHVCCLPSVDIPNRVAWIQTLVQLLHGITPQNKYQWAQKQLEKERDLDTRTSIFSENMDIAVMHFEFCTQQANDRAKRSGF